MKPIPIEFIDLNPNHRIALTDQEQLEYDYINFYNTIKRTINFNIGGSRYRACYQALTEALKGLNKPSDIDLKITFTDEYWNEDVAYSNDQYYYNGEKFLIRAI